MRQSASGPEKGVRSSRERNRPGATGSRTWRDGQAGFAVCQVSPSRHPPVLPTRRSPTAVIVELITVAGFAGLETFAVARSAPVIGEGQVGAAFSRVSGGLART